MAVPLGSDTAHLPSCAREVIIKARTSWLKNNEVLDFLQNYKAYRFPVGKEAPSCPGGGCLFLFNRRAVRFFRKDGHEWRKKSDGKTVRETHEKLKIGNKDMLNCYYAHSEAKEALQRRCYWLLEGDRSVVLVHYLSASTISRLVPVPTISLSLTAGDGGEKTTNDTSYQASGRSDIVRAASLPHKPLDEIPQPQTAFTITTGGVPDNLAGNTVAQDEGARVSEGLARASSTPILSSKSAPAQPVPSDLDQAPSIGPLHSAPSFSGGTVQTGSTLGALQTRQSYTLDSRHSSLSGMSELRSDSPPPQTSGRTRPGVIRIPISQNVEAWGRSQQPAEARDTTECKESQEAKGKNYELKPAESLTRVDSDTLKVAPSLSKATSGSKRDQSVLTALRPEASSARPSLPSSFTSPFYAAAFSGNPILGPQSLAEELLSQRPAHSSQQIHAFTCERSLRNPPSAPPGPLQIEVLRRASAPTSTAKHLESSRVKRHRTEGLIGVGQTAAAGQPWDRLCTTSAASTVECELPHGMPYSSASPSIAFDIYPTSCKNAQPPLELHPFTWMASSALECSIQPAGMLGMNNLQSPTNAPIVDIERLPLQGGFKTPQRGMWPDLPMPLTTDLDWFLAI